MCSFIIYPTYIVIHCTYRYFPSPHAVWGLLPVRLNVLGWQCVLVITCQECMCRRMLLVARKLVRLHCCSEIHSKAKPYNWTERAQPQLSSFAGQLAGRYEHRSLTDATADKGSVTLFSGKRCHRCSAACNRSSRRVKSEWGHAFCHAAVEKCG